MPGTVDVLLAENREVLEDLDALLAGLSDDAFTHPADPCYGSSIGQQTRHMIEHAEAILWATGGEVDFHDRWRDRETEQVRSAARRRLEQVLARFGAMEREGLTDVSLRVRHVVDGNEGGEDHWLRSSLARELAFLQSHSVHHMALIGMMASLHGVAVPSGFGVAPSTRRYWESQAETAGPAGGEDRMLHAASRA